MKRFTRHKLFPCPYLNVVLRATAPGTLTALCYVAREPIPDKVYAFAETRSFSVSS